MKNVALILISHGQMAVGTLASAEMIVGKIENAYAFSMDPRDAVEGIKEKLKEVVKSVKEFEHLFVMVDIIGGTPCNVALMELYGEKNSQIISGFNLAMLLEFASYKETDINLFKQHIIEAGRSQIKDLKMELMGVEK